MSGPERDGASPEHCDNPSLGPSSPPLTAPQQTGETALQGSALERLEQLRRAGGPHWDPVGFRYCESLTGAVQDCITPLARLLESRACDAIGDSLAALSYRRNSAAQILARCCQLDPGAHTALRALFERGDLKGLLRARQRLTARGRGRPLSELTRTLRQYREADGETRQADGITPGHSANVAAPSSAMRDGEPLQHGGLDELLASQFFRQAAARRHTREQVKLAVESAGDGAGPLNPHLLAARSLATLNQLSPAYLERFVSYIDTLLWLEQQDLPEPPARG